MTLTSGFYSSKDGDRKYSAEQMGELFDGLIHYGIYQSYGQALAVTAISGKWAVRIGTGRAFLNKTWVNNDAPYDLPLEQPDVTHPRWDLVCLRINRDPSVRAASFAIYKGVSSSNPQVPNVRNTDLDKWYPLARIRTSPGMQQVTYNQIWNARGSSATPWVTGVVESLDASTLYAKWDAQYEQWSSEQQKAQSLNFQNWMSDQKSDYESWRNTLKTTLDGNAATKLAQRLDNVEKQISSFTQGVAIKDVLLDAQNGAEIQDHAGNPINAQRLYVMV